VVVEAIERQVPAIAVKDGMQLAAPAGRTRFS
jgi:hypothetical protein